MLTKLQKNRKSDTSNGGKLQNTFRTVEVLLGSQEQDVFLHSISNFEYS